MTGLRLTQHAVMLTLAARALSAADSPKEWIDKDTGRRVIRLSVEDGTREPTF